MECKDVVEINGVEYVRRAAMETAGDNYCIVRTYSAGVFAGNLAERNGKEGTVKNARRIWYWDGAASLSQLAMEGTKAPDNCKFPCPVNELTLTEIIEIIPCTKVAEKSIKEVPVWEQ
jgi:hypothetical protein